MRLSDLIRASLGGLWRQKARSALTLLGVAVGTTALAYTLSLGVGLREFIENEFKSRREFWWVNVHPPNYGRGTASETDVPADKLAMGDDIPPDRRDRLRKRLIQDYQRTNPPKPVLVTPEQVETLRRLPDVEQVRTYRTAFAQVNVGDGTKNGLVYAGPTDDFEPTLDAHLIAGRNVAAAATDEAVVSEFMLHRLGLTTDAQMRAAVGQRLRITLGLSEFAGGSTLAALLSPGGRQEEIGRRQAEVLDRIAKQLPAQIDKLDLSDAEKAVVKLMLAPKPSPGQTAPAPVLSVTAEFTIVGVTRLPDAREPDPADLLAGTPLPPYEVFLGRAAEGRVFGKMSDAMDGGFTDVAVRVRPGGDLEAVVDAIEGDGLKTYNALKFYTSVKREVTLISAGLNLFAMLSMLVAAIGIMNTLFTSVLERTREIGVLKAVGARDGHILGMFLLEGAAVGLIGGAAGLLAAWVMSVPSDGWVKSLIEHQRGEPLLTKTFFGWPGWLPPAVLGFAVLLTTLAAVYPARRASRVQPVEALRHE